MLMARLGQVGDSSAQRCEQLSDFLEHALSAAPAATKTQVTALPALAEEMELAGPTAGRWRLGMYGVVMNKLKGTPS